ncbi:MAG: NAD-dependent epimerase/dehydratase family protein, partial [bacterium]
MRIYITGGTGFIGSYVTARLAELRKHELIILARNPEKTPALKTLHNTKIVKAPFDDYTALKKHIIKPDALIHIALCWGDTGPDMLANETLSSVKLIDLAVKRGAKKIVFTSSTAASGYSHKRPSEETMLKPSDFYGAGKGATELFISA